MANQREVIALLASDFHICNCPVARSAEPDWFAAMARPFDELRRLQNQYQVPIVGAGDVFDRWNSSIELANWAIEHVPFMYTIPGQHDLPQHSHEEIHRSAYQTLVLSGSIQNVPSGVMVRTTPKPQLALHAFPWGVSIEPLNLANKQVGEIHLAVIHKYVYAERSQAHPGALPDAYVGALREKLTGYDAVVIGDNHGGWISGRPGQQYIMNCGTFMRRKSDEMSCRPQIGLLYSDGTIEAHYLDISQDLFIDDVFVSKTAETVPEGITDVDGFLEGVRTLSADSLDFREAVRLYLNDHQASDGVRDLVLSAIE